MSTITLIVIPGPGARSIQFSDNITAEHLVCQENLHGRDIIINGVAIAPDAYRSTVIPNGSEVFATGSVKGNNI